MPVYSVSGGTAGSPTDLDQLVDAISGNNDTDVTLFTQLSPPAAPTVSVNTTSGNLTGNYQYALGYETGYWQGPTGSGTWHTKGNTGGGAASITVSPNAQQVNVDIPAAPTGVGYVPVYRTQANGSTFYYLTSILANTSSQFTDNIPDSSLGAAMPTTNTTGGIFSGNASGLTNIPAANLTGGPIPAAVLPPANSTTLGTSLTAQNPASGSPVAIIANPASQAGQSINGPLTVTDLAVSGMTGAQTQSRYVGAVSGAAPTTGTFEVGDFVLDVTNLTLWICTAAGSPGTWSNFNYLRTDANAPSPQIVANQIYFDNIVRIQSTQSGAASNSPEIKLRGWSGTATTGVNFAAASGGGMYISNVADSAVIFLMSNSGDISQINSISIPSGQLGSASGTWTPASGTFNVAAGTVINVASVPSGAKNFYAGWAGGYIVTGTQNTMLGTTTSAGSSWMIGGGTVGYASALSSTTFSPSNSSVQIYDGSYEGVGYYQLNGGYLQFVMTSAATASTNAQNTIRWGVS